VKGVGVGTWWDLGVHVQLHPEGREELNAGDKNLAIRKNRIPFVKLETLQRVQGPVSHQKWIQLFWSSCGNFFLAVFVMKSAKYGFHGDAVILRNAVSANLKISFHKIYIR
jgi:hypothetical protein